MSALKNILICDDDLLFHQVIKRYLASNYYCKFAIHTDEAFAMIKKGSIHLLLLDIHIRTKKEGLDSLKKFLEYDKNMPIVMLSGNNDLTVVREAMRLGAYDYLTKDFSSDELKLTVERALKLQDLICRESQKNFEVESFQKRHVFIGKSLPVQILRKTIEKYVSSRCSVLITGETGTGKEIIARQLRGQFPDGSLAPFIAVDSSTIHGAMAESVLFGHEKGAFTGAERTTKGIFEEAHCGIVYFDEISNMPLPIQSKLLRVLQEKEFNRIGSTRIIESNFRTVCATNKILQDLVDKNEFKEDLFQRLNVLPIFVPPLRDRIEDIPLLCEYFLKKGLQGPLTFSDETYELLKLYHWPGNIRELSNLISYLVVVADGPIITADLLPQHIRNPHPLRYNRTLTAANPENFEDGESLNLNSFYQRINLYEQKILQNEYHVSKGNISHMANRLGIDRSHLYTKLKTHGIHITK